MTTLAWVTVAEQLRRDIQARRIGPNGELDTEAELCQRFLLRAGSPFDEPSLNCAQRDWSCPVEVLGAEPCCRELNLSRW
jgi:hypothetical protein